MCFVCHGGLLWFVGVSGVVYFWCFGLIGRDLIVGGITV